MHVEIPPRAAAPAERPKVAAVEAPRRAPTPPIEAVRAPAPATPGTGELRLRVPRTYVVKDVALPLVYH